MDDIKLVLLKTGQTLISKLSELRDEKENAICFLFEVPLVVAFSPESTKEDLKVSFSQWIPFSSSPAFRVPFDQVITIGDVKEGVLQKYIEVVKPYYPIDGTAEMNPPTEESNEND